MLKHKKILFLFSLLFILIPFFSSFGAQNIFYWRPEVKYPTVTTSSTTKSTISATTTIPEYIKYIFNFAILIGIIVAVLSLIYGGFLYLTSGDNPQQLANAKSQIFSAFLGLIIILTSHLLFTILNPSLTIVNLPELIGIDEGFLLRDQNGREIKSAISLPNIQQLYGPDFLPRYIEILPKSIGRIKVEVYSKPYYTGTKNETDSSLNTNFDIESVKIIPLFEGVYLYGPPGREIKIVNKPYLFPSPEIEGDTFVPTKYLYSAWSNDIGVIYSTSSLPVDVILKQEENGTASTTIHESKHNLPSLNLGFKPRYVKIDPQCLSYVAVTAYAGENFTSTSREFSLDSGQISGSTPFEIKSIKIKIVQCTCPGNPLHDSCLCPCPNPITDINPAANGFKGNFSMPVKCAQFSGIRFEGSLWVFTTSTRFTSVFGATDIDIADFSKDPAFKNINDKVAWVMLKNKIDYEGHKKTDYGVILSENPNFSGNFKIFLEDRTVTEAPYYHIGNVPWDNPDTTTTESYIPLMMSSKTTKWGKVTKPSSARVFDIDPNGECQVTLYKLRGFETGKGIEQMPCVIRVNKDNPPIYYPKDVNDICEQQGDGKFEDKIYSIKIDGKCIVALADIRPKEDEAQLEPSFPGGHSYVTKNSILNVSDFPIGRCGGFLSSLFGTNFGSCISGIAVIPYK